MYGLREIYHELGDYVVKVVLSPKFYTSAHDLQASLVDSTGAPLPMKTEVWGRKMHVKFAVNNQVAEGVATLTLSRNGRQLGQMSFWVIK